MQVYHFYQLLPSLTKSEVRNFRSFLKLKGASGERLLPLYDHIKRFLPDLSHEKRLDPTAIYRHFHPQAARPNRKLILNQLSALHKLLMDFLLDKKLKEETQLIEFLKLEILQERSQEEAYHRKSHRLINALEGASPAGSWDQLFLARVYEHQILHNTQDKLPDKAAILRKLRAVLDEGYLAGRYKFAAARVKFHQFVEGKKPEPEPELTLEHGPLSEAYRLVYRLEQYGGENDFRVLRKMIMDMEEGQLPWEDQYEVLTSLVNFTADRIRRKEMQYLREAFELYRYGLERTILLRGRGLTTGKFSNIVSLGCSLEEFDWTLAFIRQYREYLPVSEKVPLSVLSEANVLMEQKKYQDCLEKLESHHFSHPNYSLRERLLKIRALYEIPVRDEDRILQACRNFRSFLQSNRSVKGDNRKSAVHFIRMVRALVRRRKSRADLELKLKELRPIFHQNWIMGKLASYTSR